MKLLLLIVLALFVLLQNSVFANEVAPIETARLKTNMMVNPLGIGTSTPRFSWQICGEQRGIVQEAYQILVASTPEKLMAGDADLWNSGKVACGQSIQIPYGATPLKSKTFCYWKVKVWTNYGELAWSEPAFFSIGLLYRNEWKARWIGMDHANNWDDESLHSRLSARYLRKQIDVKKDVKRATVYIVGLGMYELYLNGDKIGNQVLAPVPTDYHQSVTCNTFDVTTQIQDGENAIGVVLGNGRYYNMRQNFKPYKIKSFGYPKLLFQLEIEYANGTRQSIISDESWKLNVNGPIRSNNEYDGEIYDATREFKGWNTTLFSDSTWQNAKYVEVPEGLPVAASTPNMVVASEIKPKAISQLKPGVFIMDFGQNFSGWVKFSAMGQKGDTLTMRFAESLQADGSIYTENLRDALSRDQYIFKGEGVETWEPSFVYHGFRYVEITGFKGTPKLENFTGRVVYDKMESVGSFESSDTTLSQIYKNAWWSILSNYKGMPVDCPQRNERQPWLGDRAMGAMGESYLFDNGTLYAKWLNDISDSQLADGSIPDMSPAYFRYYSDNVTWPSTYLIIANILYEQYGDVESIKTHYGSMKLWMDYMRTRYMDSNWIITKDSYGDWCLPPTTIEEGRGKSADVKNPNPLISTAYYYHLLGLMNKFAALTNHPDDIQFNTNLADSIKAGFHRQYYHPKTNSYGGNTVTENILPLAFGMVDSANVDKVFENITEIIVRQNKTHISSGLIGMQWLMHTLTENGRSDVAYRLASNRDYPSWGYMIENGATTIWELWNSNVADASMNSQNHVMMLGDLLTWMFQHVGGIQSGSDGAAYQSIILKPEDIEGLNHANVSYNSAYGKITSNWSKSNQQFKWNVTIPANTHALVYIPIKAGATITEGKTDVLNSPSVKYIRIENRTAIYEIGSGSFSFTAKYKWRNAIVADEFVFERSDFPESHGSTIAETPKGLVVAWFGGTKERNPDCSIYVSRRVNNKWTQPTKVVDGVKSDTLRYALWNPVLYQVPNGKLMLFYKEGTQVSKWVGKYILSDDGGATWSTPIDLPEGYLGPVKNKPVLLKNGTLICPSSTENEGWRVHFEITNDFGKTWSMVGPINNGDSIKGIQPSVLSYKDGKLQIICRSRNRALLQSWSSDNGQTWSPLVKTNLPNNNSGTDAVTLKDGRQLLVYNHVLPPGNEAKGPRTPLNVSISDDGINWKACLLLENSPVSQYSYPSVIQGKDGMIHIVYTWRRERIKYVKIDPKKLTGITIVDGQWPRL